MNNQGKKIKKEKVIVISILLVVMLLILVLLAIKLNIFSGFAVSSENEEKEKLIYHSYKQICSKDEDYFKELAMLVGGSSKKLREIKSKSIYCHTSDVRNITKREFEDMSCECLERDRRGCLDGWELRGNICYKEKLYTNSLKACSFYRCDGNYYVEVFEKEG